MKNSIKIYASSLIFLCFVWGCDSSVAPKEQSAETPSVEPVLTTIGSVSDVDVKKTLVKVRNATANFHNISKALDAGYVLASPFVPNMGYHYVNEDLVDDIINPTEPEVLVYIDSGNGKEDRRKLVAAEYLIPEVFISQQSDLDNMFPGIDGSQWHHDTNLSAWTLHAWIWYSNPDGVFHATNPRVGD